MDLEFTIGEIETLAFCEQYYRDSKSHKRLRSGSRWTLPILLLPLFALFTFQFGFSFPSTVVFLASALAWVMIAPKRFDMRIQRHIKKQMQESSYEKNFGTYQLKIEEQNLVADSPTGHAEYRWDAIDRVLLTDEFLFIFLAGPAGFPIRIAEIGEAIATEAHEKIRALVTKAK